MTIGERVRERRIELGLSVDDLARRLGKNRATVYRYENSYIENMPVGIIEPLAVALNTTPGYLMGWEDKQTACKVNHITVYVGNNEIVDFDLSSEQIAAVLTILENMKK